MQSITKFLFLSKLFSKFKAADLQELILSNDSRYLLEFPSTQAMFLHFSIKWNLLLVVPLIGWSCP